MASPMTGRRWWKAGLFFAVWTLIGLSFASQFYVSSSAFGTSVSWGEAVGWALGDWYVWAMLSLPIIWLARRRRFERGSWVGSAGIHLAASALFSVVYMVLRAWVGQWQAWLNGQTVSFVEVFSPLLVKTFHFNLLIYWVIVTVTHAFEFYRKFQERELRAAELEKRLAQARLQALQMQLNPHFLFNTLHTISALVHKEAEAADRMIARLSDLLRYALESTEAREVTLRQELSFLDRYLEIERTRFGERLKVAYEIAPDTLEALVPNLILQPLVENAIRHGIEPHAKPGRIELMARRNGDRLEIAVRDNGGGLKTGEPVVEGVGLSNTRARLMQLYGGEHVFELNSPGDAGLEVRVAIPFERGSGEELLRDELDFDERAGELEGNPSGKLPAATAHPR